MSYIPLPNSTNARGVNNDTGYSIVLKVSSSVTLSANRTISISGGDSSYNITLNGNVTLNDWFDQSVKTTASPTFAGINSTPIGATTPSTGAFTTLSSTTGANFATSSGNVGIGTTGPGAELEVSGDGTDSQIRLTNTPGATNYGTIKQVTAHLSIESEGLSNFLTLHTGNNERVRIDAAGNVGIGTTGPNYPLDIWKTSAGAETIALNLRNNNATQGTAVALAFTTYNSDIKTGKISLIRADTGSGRHDMAFSMWDGSGLNEKMRIQGTGNVGIGTTSPGYTLDVQSSSGGTIRLARSPLGTYPSALVMTSDGAGGYISTSGGAQPLIFRINDAEKVRIDTAGNVGIGTTNPRTVLDLGSFTAGRSISWAGNNSVGSSYSQGALSLLTGLKMNIATDGYLVSATGTYHHAGIRIADFTSTGNISFFNESTTARTADDVFDYVAATKMVITPTGNVGIGTTTPTSTLHNNGSFALKSNTITTNTTLDSTHSVICCDSASNFALTLPAASSYTGRQYVIKNKNNGIITIDATGAGQIYTTSASDTITLANGDAYILYSDGITWIAI